MNETQPPTVETLRGVLKNYRHDPEYTYESNGNLIQRELFVSAEGMAEQVRKMSGGWPKSVAGTLFVLRPGELQEGERPEQKIRYINNVDEFEAWLGMVAGHSFRKRELLEADSDQMVSPVTMKQLYNHMRESTTPYNEILTNPHFPRLKDVYYLNMKLPAPNGIALKEICSILNGETQRDIDLMCAAMMTPFAGISPGQRPAFVFTSKHGRGVGKTSTAEAIANMSGGYIRLNAAESEKRWMERLLNPSSRTKRVILLDNVKKAMDIASLEDLITSETIQGHALYKGDTLRYNNMTVFITLNAPELSRDLAQRCVMINVGEPKREIDFVGVMQHNIRHHRDMIVADLLHWLAEEDSGSVSAPNKSRFRQWEDAVLNKFPDADLLALIIKKRQDQTDMDLEVASDLFGGLWQLLLNEGLEPETAKVVINWTDVKYVLDEVGHLDDFATVRKAGKVARGALGLGPMRICTLNTNLAHGRGLLWVGEKADEKQKSERFMRQNPGPLFGEGGFGDFE